MMTKIDELVSITLGRQRENNVNYIDIDCGEWLKEYPQGLFVITVLRPTESIPYVADTQLLDNGILRWVYKKLDVELKGTGSCEITMYEGESVKKSRTIKTRIYPEMYDCTEEKFRPEDTWLEKVQKAVINSDANANRAESEANRAKSYADTVVGSCEEIERFTIRAEQARDEAVNAESSSNTNAEIVRDILENVTQKENNVIILAQETETARQEVANNAEQVNRDVQTSSENAFNASQSAENANSYAQQAQNSMNVAEAAADDAETARNQAQGAAIEASQSAQEAKESEDNTAQAFRDFLAMLGKDVATLVNGKIPVSQIPSIATTEIYTVATEAERDRLVVENGDICIVTYNDSSKSKSFIYKDGSWIYLASPTDYASRAGYAETAGTAENANKINGHRLVEMTHAQYEQAVKEDSVYYLVYEE